MKLWKNLLVLMVLSLFVCMIVCGCGGVQSSPKKVVEAYFDAFQKKDMKTAITYTLNADLSDSKLAQMEDILKEFEIKSFKIEKVEKLNKTQATVSVEVTTAFKGDESKAVSDITVIKKDGKWYIDDGRDNDDWDEDRREPEKDKDQDDSVSENTDDGRQSETDD